MIIGNDWDSVLSPLFNGENFKKISEFLDGERKTYTIFPPKDDVFNAFKLTPYESVKVVILGQDPYHEIGQAHGLSFSVKNGTKLPPSLKNVYKELYDDLGIQNTNGDLTAWAKQGVLLLNATLTVREGLANSHSKIGWENFTDGVIKTLSARRDPIIFILWGNNARKKKTLINPQHFILESAHPSPLSCYSGFFGSKPFSKTNEILLSINKSPIKWEL